MKPSRLVTSGGARRHTARGRKKITKAALVGGAAAAAIAATVGVAAPANARTAEITTVVSWVGGDSVLAVDYPGEGVVLERSYSKTATDHWYAYSGAQIGADPIMRDANFISCQLYVNGRLDYSDYGYAGDGHDVTCVRTLL
jgi:hypothetical protein